MKCFISWVVVGLFGAGTFFGSNLQAQTGTPTATPPGGANASGTAGTAGTSQPAGRAGTTSPAGTATPAGRAGTATPATRFGTSGVDPSLGTNASRSLYDPSVSPRGFDSSTGRNYSAEGGRAFGGNPGMFNRGPTTGSAAGRTPGSAIRGPANFSGGTTSTTLQPGGQIRGAANDPANRDALRGGQPLDPRLATDPALFDAAAAGATTNIPLAPVAPVVPLAPQAFVAPTSEVAPVVPTSPVAPVILNVGETPASGRTGIERTIPVTPREPAVEQQGTATATAFPARNPTATGDATVTGSPAGATNTAAPDFTEVPTEGRPAVTTYRGNIGATGQRSGLTHAFPGYTMWQGYYWYRSPAAGWHYWDGLRWVQFTAARSTR